MQFARTCTATSNLLHRTKHYYFENKVEPDLVITN
jgi:hypothetical protein